MLATATDYSKQLSDIADALRHLPQNQDYSKQLNDIGSALSRPSTPQWIYVLIGAALALLSQFAVKWFDTIRKRYKMRKIAYSEIINMFGTAAYVERRSMEPGSMKQHWDWQLSELKSALRFRGEEYCNKDLDTFADLPERYHIEHAYARFHAILDDLSSYHVNLGLAIRIVARSFTENDLKQKYLRRWVGGPAATLLKQMRDIYNDEQERLKAMVTPAEPGTGNQADG